MISSIVSNEWSITLAEVTEWLRTQREDRIYFTNDAELCVVSRYVQSIFGIIKKGFVITSSNKTVIYKTQEHIIRYDQPLMDFIGEFDELHTGAVEGVTNQEALVLAQSILDRTTLEIPLKVPLYEKL